MRQILLDTETTGLNPAQGDRVVEIGCVELLHRRLSGNDYHVYLNPERDMPQEAYAVHGLSEAFLADKPKFSDVASEFIDYVKGAELIIHNAAFDIGFLNAELARLHLPALTEVCTSVVDTVAMARAMFPGKRASLDALCDRFEIDRAGRALHGALLDAQLLAEVYIALTRGQNTLLGETSASHGAQQGEAAARVSLLHPLCIEPSQEEINAHLAILQDIDKVSRGKTVWAVTNPDS